MFALGQKRAFTVSTLRRQRRSPQKRPLTMAIITGEATSSFCVIG
jgi:hypothetical protein